MHIYFSGIGGVGLGPLAEIALDAGYTVSGSDANESPMTRGLRERGVNVKIGQSLEHIAHVNADNPIDWVVHTSALPKNHPELNFAYSHGIRTSKRDELLARIIKDTGLKLIAIAGTHGKTTTTGMLVWLFKQFHVPVSYSIGTTISFGPSGQYDPESKYFIYECDEFDRNFLEFHPHTSIITALDYDHPEIYPTQTSYNDAFRQFIKQSQNVLMWQHDADKLGPMPGVHTLDATTEPYNSLKLAGEHNRQNGWLVCKTMVDIMEHPTSLPWVEEKLASFPGTHRRFEELAPNLYSDYAHTPVEIKATLQMAAEINPNIAVVYQPHHNVRQHEIKDDYKDCMEQAKKIYWLPTYLTREDPHLPILPPDRLVQSLTNREKVTISNLNDNLWEHIENERAAGNLVLCMGAGSIDDWIRGRLANS